MNQLGLNAPCRDKYWHEKTAAEKIETLAELLAEAHRTIRDMQERLDAMTQHAHHPYTGQVMAPPRDQYGSRFPPGYCREDFMLGKAPRDHYGPPAAPLQGWAGEAQAQAAMPCTPPKDPPPTGPEKGPDEAPAGAPDSVKSDGFIGSP